MISSFLAIWVWAAVAAQAPATPRNTPADFADAWFEGTVGNAPVRVRGAVSYTHLTLPTILRV